MLKKVRKKTVQLLSGGTSVHSHESREQAFVANIYSLLAFLSLTIFGLQHIAENNLLLGELEIIGGLTIALNALALRLTANIVLARNNLLLVMLGLLVVMLLTGGLGGTGIFWFFMFPVSAFFLTGRRGGIVWMTALFAVVLTVLFLGHLGLLAVPYPDIVVRQLLVTLFVVSVGIYAYQHARETLAKETKQSEEVSKEEKIKSETIIENIDEGIVVIDQSGRVVVMNEPAEELLGWRRRDLIGEQFVRSVPMFDRNGQQIPPMDRPLQIVLQRPAVLTAQVTYERKNGTRLPVAITSRPIIVDGEVVGAIGTFRDIREEQAVERTKTEFVTLASHQLRTPVSAIKWYAELLLSGDAGKLSSSQRDYIQQIYSSNFRLSSIIDAMLLTSDLELGNLAVRPEPVNLAQLTNLLLIDLLHMQPSKKRLRITETYSPALPSLMLDQGLIKTIMRAVLGNAIKYTPEGGKIAIAIKPDAGKLSYASKGSVRITIADTGYGIPRNQQKNIFVKLFRAANIKEKDTDGTGLGLYVSKAILEQVGGKISFSSKEGKGSTFVILLPVEGMSQYEGRMAKDNSVNHAKGSQHG